MRIRSFNHSPAICQLQFYHFSSINLHNHVHNEEAGADSLFSSKTVINNKSQDAGLVWKRGGAHKEQPRDPSSYTLPLSKTVVNNRPRWRHSLKK